MLVTKKNGCIRICGDYSVTINPNLQVDQHLLPKPDNLSASLAGNQHFTVINLSHTFQQMPLVASFPGIPISAWRRSEEECLVHTVVRMHLISNQLLRKRRKMMISNGLVFIDDICRWHTE